MLTRGSRWKIFQLNFGGGFSPPMIFCMKKTGGQSEMDNHWFPLIRPAVKPLFLGGGTLGEGLVE